MVAAVGRVGSCGRMVAIFAVYLPPKMLAADLAQLKDILTDQVLQLKANSSGEGPLIFVAGDLNRKDISESFSDFNDFRQINHDPTRGNACLDVIFSNAANVTSSVFPPLYTERGLLSDHSCVVAEITETKARNFTWIRKKIRKHTEQACSMFERSIMATDWSAVLGDGSADSLLRNFELYTSRLIDKLFPWQSVRYRSNEAPWVTSGMRRLQKLKQRVYRRDGKSRLWQALQLKMDTLTAASQEAYVERVVKQGCPRSYFRAIKDLSCKEKPKSWDVLSLFPELSPKDASNKIADYFTEISNSFDPLPVVDPPP